MSLQENKAQASPTRTPNDEEKKEKRGTFAIALTREEIEEDVFAMTGARPSRTGKNDFLAASQSKFLTMD
ncbi:hypothetical protein RJ640_013419 [Escallonia rubra]|uniref:Uncharacterized protein n=1 Tax=Escallonia rubra TaxID=112253 RepID=A0AA88QX79_9ASTE|nr:hypothetical protein RJ640_013419 [Escallonia rubra]